MPAPEICPDDFEALLRRVGELEVAVARRAQTAEIIAARTDHHHASLERHEALLRRLIDGDEPLADPRKDKIRRQRAIIVALAETTGLGYTDKAAMCVRNFITGECTAPAGHESKVVQLRLLYDKTPCQRSVWRRLKEHRDLIRAADIIDT